MLFACRYFIFRVVHGILHKVQLYLLANFCLAVASKSFFLNNSYTTDVLNMWCAIKCKTTVELHTTYTTGRTTSAGIHQLWCLPSPLLASRLLAYLPHTSNDTQMNLSIVILFVIAKSSGRSHRYYLWEQTRWDDEALVVNEEKEASRILCEKQGTGEYDIL